MASVSGLCTDQDYFQAYLRDNAGWLDTEEARTLVWDYVDRVQAVFKPWSLASIDRLERQRNIRDFIDDAVRRYLEDPVSFYDYFSKTELNVEVSPETPSVLVEGDAGWRESFSTPVPDLGILTMLSDDELDCLSVRYERLKSFSGALKRSTEDPLERLAYLRDLAWTVLGQSPHSTQLLTILALLDERFPRGRLAQVKTGEGKSLIVLLLAAYFLLEGKRIHIMTSGNDLARRDQEASKRWFEALGFSSETVCDPLSDPDRTFEASVLFGVSTDFEFLWLSDKLHPARAPRLSLDAVVVLIDEVDNLWIDSALSSARIAMPDPRDISWVFPKVMEAIKADKPEAIDSLKGILAEFPCSQVESWIRSGRESFFLKKNEDYLVEAGEIVIVEKALTGEFKRGSRWGNGLHECLEVKEGLTVQPSSRTLAAVSHPLFFRHYSTMIGLSGSLGSLSEQAELEKVYGLSTFHVPPHRPSLFIKHPPLIAPDPLTHENWLLERLVEAAHRPVILLVLTIAESFRLQAVIQKDKRFSKADRTIQVYNEKQKESKKYILDRAGYPGVVTIATHIGGRGTDYRLKGKSQAFGFLLLYLFFPENRRVELQGFGRVARQGEPGEGQYLLHPESPGVPAFFKTVPFGSVFFDQLFAWRERKNEALILHRAELLRKSEDDFEKLCQSDPI